jgi:hypothetical protein
MKHTCDFLGRPGILVDILWLLVELLSGFTSDIVKSS